MFVVEKILNWLKKHKGKDNVHYNYEDFLRGFKDFFTDNKNISFRVDKNAYYKGFLDLSAKDDILDKAGYYVVFNDNQVTFYLDIYPPRKNPKIAEKPVISLYTESYDDFQAMLDFLTFKMSDQAKENIINKYQEQFRKANNDPDKIDIIFEAIPDFVAETFSDLELINSLKSLAQKNITGKMVFGTNEEKAILNIVTALGNKDPDLLLNTLSDSKNKIDGEYIFTILYNNMDNVGGADNFNTYIKLLYKYWLASSYSKKENKGNIPYKSDKSWGFYSDNVKTSIIYDSIFLQISNDENTYVPPVSYHFYDKITLLDITNQKTDGLKFPSQEIPAFYLMAVKEVNRGSNIQTSIELGFDAVTTISGIGNLAKLRHLTKVAKGAKIILAGIEVSSGLASMITTINDCESDFCKNLNTFLFWLEMASLGADTFTKKMIRESAENALSHIDNNVDKKVIEELEKISGKSLSSIIKNKLGWSDELIKEFEKTFNKAKTIENAQSWKLLRDQITNVNAPNALFRNPNAVEALTRARANQNLKNLGATDELLAKIQGAEGVSYEQVLNNLDLFANNMTKNKVTLNNFNKVLNQLTTQQVNKRDGANWIVKYLGKNADQFKGKNIKFEEFNDTDLGGRYIDVTSETANQAKFFYEFKSVKNVPPKDFVQQFMKDLSNDDITSLDQIKWIFNGSKNPADFKKNMLDAIDKLPLTDNLAKKFLKDFNRKEIKNLRSYLKDNFDNIFKLEK